MSWTDGSELTLRPAGAHDAEACAAVLAAARGAAREAFGPTLHTPAENHAFLTGRIRDSEVWVAAGGGTVVGYLDLDADWIHSLYVHPRAQRRGAGSALLELAQAQRPDGFGLWVFVANTAARAFYRAHGLVELETTDGSANEEKRPDLRLAWPGRDPVAYLRGQIDEVDHDLADLVNRRIALTAAVQTYKETPGHAGRDPEREREIAERLAARTPDLDERTWEPVVAALVETGLDVAERRATDADRRTT